MKIVWSLLRIFYVVDVIIFGGLFAVYMVPPKEGMFAHDLIGVVLLNLSCVVIAWAFLPWPKDAKTAPKELPATPAAPPTGPFTYKSDLEAVDGQDSLQDFLDRRWRDRLAGVAAPERRKKTPKALPEEDKWEVFATDGDFATNSHVYVQVPGSEIIFTLDQEAEIDFWLSICSRTYGCQLGLRIDGSDYYGPGVLNSLFDAAVSLEINRRMRLSAGVHVAAVVIRQYAEGRTAVVVKSPEMPVAMKLKKV